PRREPTIVGLARRSAGASHGPAAAIHGRRSRPGPEPVPELGPAGHPAAPTALPRPRHLGTLGPPSRPPAQHAAGGARPRRPSLGRVPVPGRDLLPPQAGADGH